MGVGKAEGQSSKKASHEATPPLPGASPFPQLLRRVKAQLSRMRCVLLLAACPGLPRHCKGHDLERQSDLH